MSVTVDDVRVPEYAAVLRDYIAKPRLRILIILFICVVIPRIPDGDGR
jgi:hypothetical protein